MRLSDLVADDMLTQGLCDMIEKHISVAGTQRAAFVQELDQQTVYWIACDDGLVKVDYRPGTERAVSQPFTMTATTRHWRDVRVHITQTTSGDHPEQTQTTASLEMSTGETLTRREHRNHRPIWDEFVKTVWSLVGAAGR